MTRADLLPLVLLVLIAIGMGHLILTTALSVPATLAEAEARSGM